MQPQIDGVYARREQHRLKLQLEVTLESPWMYFHFEMLKLPARKEWGDFSRCKYTHLRQNNFATIYFVMHVCM